MGKDGLLREGWMVNIEESGRGKTAMGMLKKAIRNPIINYLLTKNPIMNAMWCIKMNIQF